MAEEKTLKKSQESAKTTSHIKYTRSSNFEYASHPGYKIQYPRVSTTKRRGRSAQDFSIGRLNAHGFQPGFFLVDSRGGCFFISFFYYNELMVTPKRTFGDLGERLATRYLQNKKYIILDTNFQNKTGRRLGEIDIIACDSDELVFVEVKTREMQKYSETLPEENITHKKLLYLAKIAYIYIRLKNLEHMPYRFDALSVWINLEEKIAKIKHIQSL